MSETQSLPRWRSHKVVEAFKIGDMSVATTKPAYTYRLAAAGHDLAVVVDQAYADKHRPHVGGYYVRYEDGYESWSPAEAFEGGYTLIDADDFGFSAALFALKDGARIARRGWNGKDMFLFLVGAGRMEHHALVGSYEARPYISMKTAQGDVVPWIASQSDLLVEDWFIVP